MDTIHCCKLDGPITQPWNKGKLTGAKPPLRPKHVWAIRTRLQLTGRIRDLALFNLAIDSELRGCDVVSLKRIDVAPMATPPTEHPFVNAKQEGPFASRSQSKRVKRSMTISPTRVEHPVHTSSRDAVWEGI